MSRPPLRKPARPVRRSTPTAFRCPACDEVLRVRGETAGTAFDCPACGAGLLVHRDGDGPPTVRAVGASPPKPAPRWPLALAGVGVLCGVAAAWLVLRGDGVKEEPRPPEPAPAVAAVEPEGPAVAAAVPADEPDAKNVPPVAPSPVAAADPPAPEPTAEVVTPMPEPPPRSAPTRPAVLAGRPRGDVAARRLERRLSAVLSGYQMPAPRPLREAVTDFEDLLRTPIAVAANADEPVRLDLPGPVTVGAALEALAAAAGLRAEIDGGAVRLVP